MLPTAALEYDLPGELIAMHPASPRDAARLMVVRRGGGGATGLEGVEHRVVRELPEILRAGDLLVRNVTKVVPARLRGVRLDTGGRMEGLYLGEERDERDRGGALLWRAMVKLRRLKAGAVVELHTCEGEASGVKLRLLERAGAGEGGEVHEASWRVEVDAGEAPGLQGATSLQILERVGLTPLPPYIRAARKQAHEEASEERDRREYQTVFADERDAASVAAPTAGLHFTPELDARLRERGVRFASVTLHVGMGTFKPVETAFVEQHPMHEEWCAAPAETGRAMLEARARGGRIIAVGTTTARTLESFSGPEAIAAGEGEGGKLTRILITPGYRFRNVDALMTNFHLPRSTLLAMVAAFLGADEEAVERLKVLYGEAIRERYRFYSFGDAMLVLDA